MKTLSCKWITLLLASASVPFLLAASVPIGIVVSDGHLRVNNLEVAGNATVLDGSSVQTAGATSSIRLNNGARIVFGADSRGTLSSDRLVLERGSAKIAGYSVQANTLKINADRDSSATIGLHGKIVEVAALTGNIHIFNAGGVNVANLLAGDAVNLQPQESGASAPSSLTGCVTKTGDAFLLTDTTSKVKVVLHGQNLTAGQKVQVSGRLVSEPNSKPDAPKGLEILTMKVLSGGCTSAKGAAAAGGSSAAGAAGAGGGATAAAGSAVSWTVIAGIGVAAAGTAVGIAVTQSSGSSLSDGR